MCVSLSLSLSSVSAWPMCADSGCTDILAWTLPETEVVHAWPLKRGDRRASDLMGRAGGAPIWPDSLETRLSDRVANLCAASGLH